jgi:ArsR family transcriptional regulator
MAISKSYCFKISEQRLATYGQVLAHPARVRILYLLMKRNALLFVEIADAIPLAVPTVSNHLRLLERAGLIRKAEVHFGETGYALNLNTYREACQMWLAIAEQGSAYCAARQDE